MLAQSERCIRPRRRRADILHQLLRHPGGLQSRHRPPPPPSARGAVAPSLSAASRPVSISPTMRTGRPLETQLDLRLPTGTPSTFTVPGLAFHPGRRIQRCSPVRGFRRSTMLRAFAGVWPYGEGHIGVPNGASVMLLPQQPASPVGSLRLAVSYPALSGIYPDAQLREALVAARSPNSPTASNSEENWAGRLSGVSASATLRARSSPGKQRGHFRSRRVHGGGDLQDARRKAPGCRR